MFTDYLRFHADHALTDISRRTPTTIRGNNHDDRTRIR